MLIFQYDKTFVGLLTCVFDAYMRKAFPDQLLMQGEPLPLFYDDTFQVVSDKEKADRVWRGLQKKLSKQALTALAECWLADGYSKRDELLFRYIRKSIDAPQSIEVNFGDMDVLTLSKLWKQLHWECLRLKQFARFQKAADGTYFAPFAPMHNVLPLAIEHFRDRFGDQKFLLYDLKRNYGLYYDLQHVEEVSLADNDSKLLSGILDNDQMAKDEKVFQELWKTYFKSICIKERLNPRKHKQDMPVRYWKFLTEKQ